MGRMVNCNFCNTPVDKDIADRHNNKNYHINCCKQQQDREALSDYICKLFGLVRPGPIIYSQLKNFMTKNTHYTYSGILKALEYFYDVQKNSTKNSNQAIGIVPHVYDEAQDYYSKINYKQGKVAATIEKQLKERPLTVRIVKEEKKTKQIYDLDEM